MGGAGFPSVGHPDSLLVMVSAVMIIFCLLLKYSLLLYFYVL